jgi:hypothetical protein
MPQAILSYRKVGNIELTQGRRHLGETFDCPYCHSFLTDLGSFHRDVKDIAQRGNETMCMGCGCRNVAPRILGPAESHERITHWYPLAVSPIACLLRVCTCPVCGWWFAVQDADLCNDGFAVTAAGVLERFDLSAATVPLQVLRSELSLRASGISTVHPRKMEDLVSSILAGVYDCEVHQLGYTHDGGVDLILLHGNRQIAVQVKRRENSTKRERVSFVREFLGAALLSGHSDLIYVTTAESFTAGAEKVAQTAVTRGLVQSYELISRQKLIDLLQCSERPVWWKALYEAVEKGKTVSIPDPLSYLRLEE